MRPDLERVGIYSISPDVQFLHGGQGRRVHATAAWAGGRRMDSYWMTCRALCKEPGYQYAN
jgi:hypothetical protein